MAFMKTVSQHSLHSPAPSALQDIIEIRLVSLGAALWNRNYLLRFRLLKSYGSGSGSNFLKVMVPVPVPTFEKLRFRLRFQFQLHI